MTHWYETPEFLAERERWYGELKEDGFCDIEHIDWNTGESGNLLNGFSLMDAVRTYSKEAEDYYYLASQHIRNVSRRFGAKSLEKKVWKLHSEGRSYAVIKKETGWSQSKASRFINKERKTMLRTLSKQSKQ